MEYRYLGNTGLKVSVLSYGTWLNAESELDYEIVRDCAKKCYEAGINHFDTAEIYCAGGAEVLLGRALKELGYRRENIVISTKLWNAGFGVND